MEGDNRYEKPQKRQRNTMTDMEANDNIKVPTLTTGQNKAHERILKKSTKFA